MPQDPQEITSDSIVIEFDEFLQAFLSCHPLDALLEACDVMHSITKWLLLKYLPVHIFTNQLVWVPVFFLLLPTCIKLGNRQKQFNCIRNHYNANNLHHRCDWDHLH